MKNQRDFKREYLPEFVYGSIDGTITTFAIVSGVIGASLSSAIVLILGFANLFADGFSMAVSNYLSVKSGEEMRRSSGKSKARKKAIATFFSFLVIGFIPLLSFVLAAITKSPSIINNQFTYSVILTGVALLVVGWFKGVITERSRIKSALQILIIGGIAAALAFIVGYFVSGIIG